MVRDIRYIIKRIIIGVGITLTLVFIRSLNVNAEVIAVDSNTTNFGVTLGNDSSFTGFPTSYNISNGYLSIAVHLTNYEGITRPYTYLTFAICSESEINSVVVHNTGYNSYFDDYSGRFINTDYKCQTGKTIKYVQMQVGKYADLDGTGEELQASSFLQLSMTNSNPLTFGAAYLSSDDFLTTLQNNDALLNSVNALSSAFSNNITNLDQNLHNYLSQNANSIVNGITLDNSVQAQRIINSNQTNTQNIISNQDSNTQDIIDNQTSNTQDIIDNQNENFNSCQEPYNLFNPRDVSGVNLVFGIPFSITQGRVVAKGTTSNTGVTSCRELFTWNKEADNYTIEVFGTLGGGWLEVYPYGRIYLTNNRTTLNNQARNNVSIKYCFKGATASADFTLNLIKGTEFKQYQPFTNETVCKNRMDVTNENIEQTNQKLDDLQNNINNDNVDANDSQINDLVNSSAFEDNTGLSSVINAPLSIVAHLTDSCTPINFNIPFINASGTIPCMSSSVYTKFDSGLVNTIKAIVNGFLVYRVIVALFGMVKGFKDPENDKVEVVDL